MSCLTIDEVMADVRTIPQAANEHRVSITWIHTLIKKGRLPAHQAGGVKLILDSQLQNALASSHQEWERRRPIRFRNR